MSNHTQANPSSKQPGVGTRIRGVFETAHGIGENIRGRTLGAIDTVTHSGSPESKSHHSSMADRGRMEVETGMAHIYGYPDPNAANVLRNEPVRSPQSTAGTFGSGHTTGTSTGTGYTATGENDYERGDDVGGGVERGTNRHRTDDEYGQPGGQNFERQQPAIDGNKEKGPDPSWRDDLSPNRGPQNAESEMKRGPPPELPPRAQAQATNDDHTTQMYQ